MFADYPQAEQLPALRQLWKQAFGDTDAFLDIFFSTAFSPERCRCVVTDGEVAAALYWFSCEADGQPLAYLYAVATAERFRGQYFLDLLFFCWDFSFMTVLLVCLPVRRTLYLLYSVYSSPLHGAGITINSILQMRRARA